MMDGRIRREKIPSPTIDNNSQEVPPTYIIFSTKCAMGNPPFFLPVYPVEVTTGWH